MQLFYKQEGSMIGHGVVPLLLAAVGGYWVLERAETHKGQLRKVGQFLGALIIASSLIGAVCRVWSIGTGKAFCPTHKGWQCPYPAKAMAPEAPVK